MTEPAELRDYYMGPTFTRCEWCGKRAPLADDVVCSPCRSFRGWENVEAPSWFKVEPIPADWTPGMMAHPSPFPPGWADGIMNATLENEGELSDEANSGSDDSDGAGAGRKRRSGRAKPTRETGK